MLVGLIVGEGVSISLGAFVGVLGVVMGVGTGVGAGCIVGVLGGPPHEHCPLIGRSLREQLELAHGSQLDKPEKLHVSVQGLLLRPARSDLVAPRLVPSLQPGSCASPALATLLAKARTETIPALSMASISPELKAPPALFPFSRRALLRAGTVTPSIASSLKCDSLSLGHMARFDKSRFVPMPELQITVLFQGASGQSLLSAQ